MTVVVVPFREGKSRLSQARHVRRSLALAMLGDVLAATVTIGETVVVTDDAEGAAVAAEIGAAVVDEQRAPGADELDPGARIIGIAGRQDPAGADREDDAVVHGHRDQRGIRRVVLVPVHV